MNVCESPHIFVSEWHAYYLRAYARVHRLCMSVRLFAHDFVYVYVYGLCSYVCAYACTSLECITKFMRADPCICLYVYVLYVDVLFVCLFVHVCMYLYVRMYVTVSRHVFASAIMFMPMPMPMHTYLLFLVCMS